MKIDKMSLFYRTTLRRATFITRLGFRRYCEEADKSKPVKFSTSEAASWRAEFSRKGNIYDDTPESQPYIISFSLACFLGYFLLLREESDIDQRFNIFDNNLYDRVEGLEEVDLRARRQRRLAAGESVLDIEKRLAEIEQEKALKQSP